MSSNVITFTTEERQAHKCKVFSQNINPKEFDDSELPTDIHLIEYEVEGNLYVDSVRAHKASDIFDPYYDKLTPLGGKILGITSGYGKIRPNMYNPPKPDNKK